MSRFCPPVMEVCIVCVLWICIPISGFVADFLWVIRNASTVQSVIIWCVDPNKSPDVVHHPVMDFPITDVERFVRLNQFLSTCDIAPMVEHVRMKEE